MLETMFILLLVVAILLMIIAITWESLSLTAVDIIVWIILSIGVYEIEIPYQALQSDNTLITGVHEIHSLAPFSWLFMLIALIMMLYLFIEFIFPMLQGRFNRMM